MGSWNETCGISQTPIQPGDPVVLFILNKTNRHLASGGTLFYPNDLYQPIAPAIFGIYDDFSRLDNIQTSFSFEEYDIFLKQYTKTQFRIRQSFARSSNPSTDLKEHPYPEYHDMKTLIQAIDSNLFDGLTFVMYHRELYEQIVEKTANEEQIYVKGLNRGEFLQQALDEYLAIQSKYPDNIKLTVDELIKKENEILESKIRLFIKDNFKYFENPDLYIDNEKLKQDFTELLLLDSAFNVSRILWMPQAGKGSQHADFDIAILAGEFAKKRKSQERTY